MSTDTERTLGRRDESLGEVARDLTRDLSLLVGAVLAVVAYVLVKQGKERVAEAGAPIPEQTIETVKEDVQWAKHPTTSAKT